MPLTFSGFGDAAGRRFDSPHEPMIVVDVENQNSRAAILQIVADARLGDIEQMPDVSVRRRTRWLGRTKARRRKSQNATDGQHEKTEPPDHCRNEFHVHRSPEDDRPNQFSNHEADCSTPEIQLLKRSKSNSWSGKRALTHSFNPEPTATVGCSIRRRRWLRVKQRLQSPVKSSLTDHESSAPANFLRRLAILLASLFAWDFNAGEPSMFRRIVAVCGLLVVGGGGMQSAGGGAENRRHPEIDQRHVLGAGPCRGREGGQRGACVDRLEWPGERKRHRR